MLAAIRQSAPLERTIAGRYDFPLLLVKIGQLIKSELKVFACLLTAVHTYRCLWARCEAATHFLYTQTCLKPLFSLNAFYFVPASFKFSPQFKMTVIYTLCSQ